MYLDKENLKEISQFKKNSETDAENMVVINIQVLKKTRRHKEKHLSKSTYSSTPLYLEELSLCDRCVWDSFHVHTGHTGHTGWDVTLAFCYALCITSNNKSPPQHLNTVSSGVGRYGCLCAQN